MRLAPPPASRLTRSIAATAVAAVAGLLAVAPAQAAPSTPDRLRVAQCTSTPSAVVINPTTAATITSVSWGAAGDILEVDNACSQGAGGTAMGIDVQLWGSSAQIGSNLATNITDGTNQSQVSLPANLMAFSIKFVQTGTSNVLATIAAFYSPSAPTPAPAGGDTASAAPVPASLTLSVGVDSGVVCKEGSALSGYVGEWLTLPKQGDCTVPSKPKAVLLGWSTSASFPVAIAQHQADNNWGAYELTDAQGVVTAVFVPAGHETYISGPNTLYPVFSA